MPTHNHSPLGNTFMSKKRNTVTKPTAEQQQYTPRTIPIYPKNPLQQHYLRCMMESPITVATGYPGTGKTYLPARLAATMLKERKISNITLARPNVSSSKSMGFYPGTKNEKMMNWLAPVLGALKEEFPPRILEFMCKPEVAQISMCPLELVKGMSWDDTFVIVDEAEDLTIAEIKAILTRIGTDSKIVLCGDTQQTNIARPGLQILLDMMTSDRRLNNLIGFVDFNDPSGIVRSPACKEIILGFERVGM